MFYFNIIMSIKQWGEHTVTAQIRPMIITYYLNKTPTSLPSVYPSFVFSTTQKHPNSSGTFPSSHPYTTQPPFQKAASLSFYCCRSTWEPFLCISLLRSHRSLSIVVAARGNFFFASPFHVANLTSTWCTWTNVHFAATPHQYSPLQTWQNQCLVIIPSVHPSLPWNPPWEQNISKIHFVIPFDIWGNTTYKYLVILSLCPPCHFLPTPHLHHHWWCHHSSQSSVVPDSLPLFHDQINHFDIHKYHKGKHTTITHVPISLNIESTWSKPQQSLKSWNVEFNSKNGRSLSPSQQCSLNRIHVEPQQTLKSWNVEFNSEKRRSLSPSRQCGSANWNTQLHNIISHGAINHPTIRHFTAPPTGL